ncbi:CCA tRNA nucleotidyltransferase [Phormidium sp. CCY1219]|uniref:CCA tRNA nucleotidyltransferase n=1 Tax=Phormidium sp. CCY1219 TaxID=2886104 RepID=UPI002D1EC46D|nr:CCA tRNA nucleotidyltransferase [Phormidium sp. CCY1219]MEB3826981.1 CCA tRNA nucleotidyltransferase [Phormidium sp. CCY1219]
MNKPGESICALTPESWPFALELLPPEAYLVGGAVRDALLNRESEYLDLDFVLPKGALKTARQIADRYKAGFVVLDAERKIARVVFENATVDFAKQEGMSLERDLRRRDFTINAIAYHPHTRETIDPLNGREDLHQRLIRMVSPTNLADDPLRLLRAYRQGAQLGFTLDRDTEAAIAQLGGFLRRVAAERVNAELWYLLNLSGAGSWVAAAWENGLLRYWLPSATEAGVAILTRIDEAGERLAQKWPQLGEMLSVEQQQKLKISGYLAIAKWVALLPWDPKEAEAQLMQLKFGRAQISAVTKVIKGWQMIQSETENPGQRSLRSQYFLFRALGPMFPALAVLAVAAEMPVAAIGPLIERYLDPRDRLAHPKTLVRGTDIMAALNIPSGPQIGQLLEEIQVAYVEGRISTAEEALEFAAHRCEGE